MDLHRVAGAIRGDGSLGMSSQEAVKRGTTRSASGPARLRRAWRALPRDRRLAAGAALGLFLALFLPWYQETGLASAGSRVQAATASLTGWAAFSWVEAAVLLVAIGVLALIFLRAEGRAFHLPGGDGVIVMTAGGWTCLLVIWRIFDKQGVTSHGQFATTSGIEWGIFITLAVAGALTYAGSRIRAAHAPEPPLPGDAGPAALPGDVPGAGDPEPWPETVGAVKTRRRVRADAGASRPQGVAGPAGVGAHRGRRAMWAEPVEWDEPTTIAEPPVLPTPTAQTRVIEPADGPRQLRIPLEGESAD
ncbi:MAG: hypothetical protein M3071_21530 [Actinomycetota bacterium]|nr:hypothetical protein [Actinomycetota bacterium]